MKPAIVQTRFVADPESVVEQLKGLQGTQLLRSRLFEYSDSRFSIVVTAPFLTFRSFGSRCEIMTSNGTKETYGNPWAMLDTLMDRFELPDEADCPFPLGGAFGYWGYGLKSFVEPRAIYHTLNDLELPDCHVGFYDSLLVTDHREQATWIVSTGQTETGDRSEPRLREALSFWQGILDSPTSDPDPQGPPGPSYNAGESVTSLDQKAYEDAVRKCQEYIRIGHIYQVNLSRRITEGLPSTAWDFHKNFSEFAPAPFGAWLDLGDLQITSTSPELFLKVSGSHIRTRPIKGTRPRSNDPTRDAQLAYELQTSEKERAELLMITDLLRNDLGRICDYGSIQVPDLMKLERFSHVHHQVSTVEGRLRNDVTHFKAFASCFPGGSITGAPKIRAMEIIDELEPVARGPYTGCIGYIGFNRESQLNIAIRIAIHHEGKVHYHTGAGIVADSDPEAEWEETNQKAAGFMQTLEALRSEKLHPRKPLPKR